MSAPPPRYAKGQRVRLSFGDTIFYGAVERIQRQQGVQVLFVRTEHFGQLVPIGADSRAVEAA
jgi:hypothetical protein